MSFFLAHPVQTYTQSLRFYEESSTVPRKFN